MKIRIFQSAEGDCLLVTGKDDTRILVDGGRIGSFRTHVAPFLGTLRERGEQIDVAYVSHIDRDHIEGILELMDNHVLWRVFRHHQDNPVAGVSGPAPPEHPEPPLVGEIWHNSFRDMADENAGPIADLFAAMTSILAYGSEEQLREFSRDRMDLATSERQALRLSQRIRPEQLDIPLNPRPPAGRLMFTREGAPPFDVGSLTVTVVGPFEADLERLRDEWNDWLEANEDVVEDLRREAEEDQAMLLAAGAVDLSLPAILAAQALGNRDSVSPPNLASLMVLLEEDGKTVLLTGDGHEEDIIRGLEQSGTVAPGEGLHVDVFKVPHHGSEFNMSRTLAKRVTADHYLFCGNGSHHNPDERIVEVILKSRMGEGEELSPNPEVDRPFKVWFSSSEKTAGTDTRRQHLKKVRSVVRSIQNDIPGRLSYSFSSKSSVEFEV